MKPTLPSFTALLAAVLALALAASCSSTPRDPDTRARPVLGFHAVRGPGDERDPEEQRMWLKSDCSSFGRECARHDGSELRLEPGKSFELAGLYPTTDAVGYPALGLTVAESDRAAFRLWTAERTGRDVAVVIGGRVHSTARLEGELSTGVVVAGHYSEGELRDLIAQLKSP